MKGNEFQEALNYAKNKAFYVDLLFGRKIKERERAKIENKKHYRITYDRHRDAF